MKLNDSLNVEPPCRVAGPQSLLSSQLLTRVVATPSRGARTSVLADDGGALLLESAGEGLRTKMDEDMGERGKGGASEEECWTRLHVLQGWSG